MSGERGLPRLLFDLAVCLILMAVMLWQVIELSITGKPINFEWAVIMLLCLIYQETGNR